MPRHVLSLLSPLSSLPVLFILCNGQKAIYPFHISEGWSPRSFELLFWLISSSGMGRVKLQIKRLENGNGRLSTYAKRRNGIIKKANELSVLCDVEILLIMFSPSGKPTLFKGKDSSIEGVIDKFAQLTPQERAKRKLESLEVLKKAFKKFDHEVNMLDLIGISYQSIVDLTNEAKFFQTQLLEVQKRLSYWTNPDKIESIEQLWQMEDSLRESLNQIRACKENFSKKPILELGCNNQFQNGLHLPFSLSPRQQLQPLSWIPNDDSQQMVSPKDLNLFPKREMEYSTGTSFGSSSSYFGTGEKVEIANTGQENGFLDEITRTKALTLELYAPCLYPPNNFSVLCDKKFQTAQQMSLREDYWFDGKFEPLSQSGYVTTLHNWPFTSRPCAVAPLDELLYSQQYYLSDDHVAKELLRLHVKAARQSNAMQL